MVAASNGHVGHEMLPELPSAESTRRDAPRRAESVPPAAAGVTESDGQRLRWALPAASGVLSGASLLHAQPPSLAQTWTRHRKCAEHYELWPPVRWGRYAWGGVHVALKAVLHVVEWVTDSPPRLLVAAALVAACWFWS